MRSKARQYTIRNVPPSVDRALRKKAAERGTSLNGLLLAALAKEAGVGDDAAVFDDLDAFVGTWVDDPAVDAALREQRTVDERDWR
jgi:hypothetical protein